MSTAAASDVLSAVQAGATTTGLLSVCAAGLTLYVVSLRAQHATRASSSRLALIAVLATFNLLDSLTYMMGRAFVPPANRRPSSACVMQGFLMQFSSSASFLWILFICLLLLGSVSGGRRDLLGQGASARLLGPPLALTLVLSATSCLIIGGADVFGDAILWCWVAEPVWAMRVYYVPLICIWIVAVSSLLYVGVAVHRRASTVRREERQRMALSPSSAHAAASTIEGRAIRQLVGYVVVFIAFSTFGLANRLDSAAHPADRRLGWLLVLQAWTMPLQGLANALVFSLWLRRSGSGNASGGRGLFSPRARPMPQEVSGVALAKLDSCSSPAESSTHTTQPPPTTPQPPPSSSSPPQSLLSSPVPPPPPDARLSIFAATWNVGEAEPPKEAAALARWLPAGRDCYCIALQECLAPGAWQRALREALALHVHTHPATAEKDLGGASGCGTSGGASGGGVAPKYELLTERRIGSTNTKLGYHGYILLLVFAAKPLCASGALLAVASGGATVRRGTKIGAARAANKGAVGAALRFHRHTIAVVSAHLAADKKGRVHLARRLSDVRQVLQDLELEYDESGGCGAQLSCHHVVLLGDLNFRCTMAPDAALDALAACDAEQLLATDELRGAMRNGQVLHAFREPKIRFHPSFRRIAGAAGRMTDAELQADATGELLRTRGLAPSRLRQLYSLAASDGTERTPSYTDRILLHSLPTLRHRLVCVAGSYRCCEALDISDHRPISAELTLTAPQLDSGGGSAAAAASLEEPRIELAMLGLTVHAGAPGPPPSPRTGAGLTHAAPSQLTAASAAATAATTATADDEGDDDGAAALAMARAAAESPLASAAIHAVELLLPLPAERSGFALERLQSLFADGSGGGDGVGGGGAGAGGGEADYAHLKLPWADAATRGIRARARLSGGAIPHFALLKLLDAAGGVLGEGVLAVQPPTTRSSNEPMPFEVELTVQGCLVGVMRGEAVVAWATGAV